MIKKEFIDALRAELNSLFCNLSDEQIHNLYKSGYDGVKEILNLRDAEEKIKAA